MRALLKKYLILITGCKQASSLADLFSAAFPVHDRFMVFEESTGGT